MIELESLIDAKIHIETGRSRTKRKKNRRSPGDERKSMKQKPLYIAPLIHIILVIYLTLPFVLPMETFTPVGFRICDQSSLLGMPIFDGVFR